MQRRGLFVIVVFVLAASFLASFLDPSITGDVVRSSRTQSMIINQQPVSVVSSPSQEKALSSLQSLVLQQFPALTTTNTLSGQKSKSTSSFFSGLICPWESRTCESLGFVKKENYPMTQSGLTTCIQQSLTACQQASKNAAIAKVKLCSQNAQASCTNKNIRAADRIPEKFCFFKQVSDVIVNPCFLNSIHVEGSGQHCFALFTDQGTLQQSLRCQPSTKTAALQVSCSATYKVFSTHSCKVDSVIKSASRTLTY